MKVGSAGKIFSLTGWKVGWVVAPPALGEPIAKAHQFLTFSTPPDLQAAAAYGLGKEERYVRNHADPFAASRDALAAGLKEAGLRPCRRKVPISSRSISPPPASTWTTSPSASARCGTPASPPIPVSSFYAEAPVTQRRPPLLRQEGGDAGGRDRGARCRPRIVLLKTAGSGTALKSLFQPPSASKAAARAAFRQACVRHSKG